MGVITDFFLASGSDVARVLVGWQLPTFPGAYSTKPEGLDTGGSEHSALHGTSAWSLPPKPNPLADPAPHIDTLPNVPCKGMLPDKLALLFASLAEVDAEQALDLILLGYLTGPPESEVTVQRLPLALTSALANAKSDDLVRAAKVLEQDDNDGWGSTFRGAAAELTMTLQRLQGLAQRGIRPNLDLFVWTCT